jgi:hypothetical protein
MIKTIILSTILVLGAWWLGLFFFSSSFFGLGANLLLIILVIIILLFNWRQALWLALFGGLLWDLYSPLNFGFYTLSFLLTAILIYYLAANYLATKSLYSLEFLILIAAVVFNLLLLIFSNLANFFNLSSNYLLLNWQFLGELIIQIIINFILAYIFYKFYRPAKKPYYFK